MRAHAADFTQIASLETFAGHRQQTVAFKETEVVAELDCPQTEGTRTSECGEFEGLRSMFRSQRKGFGGFVILRTRALPDHFEHDGFFFDLPTIGSGTGPCVTVEVFARL